jgi:curli biogenesis system outer membrane secretion channel CsgG
MRKVLLTLAALTAGAPLHAVSDGLPVVGVVEFENLAGPLPWWGGATGQDLAALLSDGLASTGSFSVMSRLALADPLEPGASEGATDESSRYLVRAAVSYYSESRGGRGSRFRVKGITLNARSRGAQIAVDFEIVDASTGRSFYRDTLDSRSGGLDLDVGYYEPELSGGLSRYRGQPAGKVIGKVIARMTREIECALAEEAACGR